MRVWGTVKDAKREKPIPNAKISLFIGERELAALDSDSNGEFEYKETASYIGETLICQVEMKGYHPQKASYKIEKDEIPLDIELVPIIRENPFRKFFLRVIKFLRRRWPIVAGGAAAIVIIVVALIIFKPETKLPIIQNFNANPDTINERQSSTLEWNVSGADEVKIEPEIGNVDDSGSKIVKPSTTTTYKLIAKNKAGEIPKSCKVIVIPLVFSKGQKVVRGTYSFDLDKGMETAGDADFWWEQVTKVERYIVPRNGAKFYILGRKNFDSISYENLIKLRYSSTKLNGSTTSNQIPQGTVVAVITSQGRYCKFRIDVYGYNLTISWVTYS